MDLRLQAFTGAVHLIGVAIALRRLYQPPVDTPEPIKAALSDIARHEAMRSLRTDALEKRLARTF